MIQVILDVQINEQYAAKKIHNKLVDLAAEIHSNQSGVAQDLLIDFFNAAIASAKRCGVPLEGETWEQYLHFFKHSL